MRSLFVVFAGAVSLVSVAAENPVSSTTTSSPQGGVSVSTTALGTPKAGKIVGGVELRPSYRSEIGEFHTENYLQLGYKFGTGPEVIYRQELSTNIYDPKAGATQGGLGLFTNDGFFRARVNDIWKDGALSFSYEARAYVPTYAPKRDAGMITAVRNYAKLKAALASNLSVSLEEVPIVHLYSQPGAMKKGRPEANPIIENRVYLNTEYQPVKGLKLFVPIILGSSRFREWLPKAKNNDDWAHKVWIHPELTYQVSPNTALGIAYYSDNLIKADFSGTTLSDGFKRGVPQLILSASL